MQTYHSLLKCAPKRSLHISHAKIAACEAASLAAKTLFKLTVQWVIPGSMIYIFLSSVLWFCPVQVVILGFIKRVFWIRCWGDFQSGPTATFS